MVPRAGFDPASPTRKASILSILRIQFDRAILPGPSAWLPGAAIRGFWASAARYSKKHHSPSSAGGMRASMRTPGSDRTESLGR